MLNSPSNPSGAVYSAEELKALAAVLAKHPHVWFMSDDIYEKILYTGEPFPTMAKVVPEMAARCLTINGVSKAFAMTGWRCGYGAGPAELIRGINLVQGQSVSHTSSVTQAAAVAALDGPMDFLPPFVAAYRRRRDLVVAAMRGIEGVECMVPDGAFYVFPNVEAVGMPAEALQSRLLDEAGVACLPGTAFGAFGVGHLRLSYANSVPNIERALAAMGACLAL